MGMITYFNGGLNRATRAWRRSRRCVPDGHFSMREPAWEGVPRAAIPRHREPL